MATNSWKYNNTEFTENDIGDAFGFVYLIKNKTDNRLYIGKKWFTKAGRRSIKGKKKKVRINSDWQDYYSSSEALKEDVEKLGKDNFERIILRLCYSRSECTYWEAHYQFEYKVLLTDDYNAWISCKVRKNRNVLK